MPPQSLPSSRVFHWVAEPLAYVMTVATAVAVYHSCADVSAAASWHGWSPAVEPYEGCSNLLNAVARQRLPSTRPTLLASAEHVG